MTKVMVSLIASTCLLVPSLAAAQSAPAASASPATSPPPAAAPAAPPATQQQPPAQPNERPAEERHPAPNSVYAEGLGAGFAYSVNYERLIIDDLGVRLGFSYLSFGASASSGSTSSSSSATFLSFPLTASYIGLRSGKSALELGAGTTITYASAAASGLGTNASGSGITPYGVALVGYRLHPLDHAGFQFRIGAMALAGNGLSFSKNSGSSFGVLPWGYISFGGSF
jgi:hypothetical protein